MRVKVVLARVIEFLFTKLYNVSHFAGIPAVPHEQDETGDFILSACDV
jgi:hypothetical protein